MVNDYDHHPAMLWALVALVTALSTVSYIAVDVREKKPACVNVADLINAGIFIDTSRPIITKCSQ